MNHNRHTPAQYTAVDSYHSTSLSDCVMVSMKNAACLWNTVIISLSAFIIFHVADP